MRFLIGGVFIAAVLAASATTPLRVGAADAVCAGDLKPVRLNRLSKQEFAQTIEDLLGADVLRALPAVSGLVKTLPDDDTEAGFSNINWTLSSGHVSTYLSVANEVGVQISRQDALRKILVPCAAGSPDASDACAASFIDSFATRAYRRPLEPEEKERLLAFFKNTRQNNPDAALSALITRVLMSPNFLFKQEIRGTAADCGTRTGDSSYRLASRLSYGLWGRMPDAELFAAAARHDLLDDDKLSAQIARMLADPRAHDWMQRFFRQWLRYDQKPIEGYSKEFLGSIDRAHLHDAAIEEFERFTSAVVWTDRGSFNDLLTSRKVFTGSASIRAIYGLLPGKAREGELVPATRAGMLTRVAMLTHGQDETAVIKRGALVRRQVLCDAISPPDPSKLEPGALTPPPADPKLTTRQRWEARTSPPVCAGCHRRLNPLGFSLESYDGIGRFRLAEKHEIPQSSPARFDELPINTTVVPNLQNDAEPTINGPVALSKAIGASKKANRCFVRQLTKFVTARQIEESDLDTIETLSTAMMQPGGSIQDTLVGIVKQIVRKQDFQQ